MVNEVDGFDEARLNYFFMQAWTMKGETQNNITPLPSSAVDEGSVSYNLEP